MTSTARKVLQDALALPSDERTALIEALSDSLNDNDSALSPAWLNVVSERIRELESGDVKPVEWSEVEARIKRTLRKT